MSSSLHPAPKATETADPVLDPVATHARQYLEASVVPVLVQGLKSLVQDRPENPVDYLAMYLLKHNPKQPSGVGVEVPFRANPPTA